MACEAGRTISMRLRAEAEDEHAEEIPDAQSLPPQARRWIGRKQVGKRSGWRAERRPPIYQPDRHFAPIIEPPRKGAAEQRRRGKKAGRKLNNYMWIHAGTASTSDLSFPTTEEKGTPTKASSTVVKRYVLPAESRGTAESLPEDHLNHGKRQPGGEALLSGD